ncbi:MAG TPA: class I SAM-dependent methyltransferase [Reyranella sp.]|nr:class I SAM-dependent methyltransferase [Reyranella sp.]
MDSKQVGAHWEANAEAWTKLAARGFDIYRDALNTPSFLAMLPPVKDLAGLDIGCGDGSNTRRVAGLGARMTAVDIAPTFVRHAQEAEAAEPLGIDFRVADGTALPFAAASFDFVTAFMCLMDMPDQAKALAEAERVLKPGGFLQFSILHPCFVPPHRKTLRDAEGRKYAIEVAGYFDRIDGRIDTWWFETLPPEERATTAPFQVPRFHRTLSEWVEMIVAAGLALERVVEPRATDEVAAAWPTVADTQIAPIFLLVRARKAG